MKVEVVYYGPVSTLSSSVPESLITCLCYTFPPQRPCLRDEGASLVFPKALPSLGAIQHICA